MADIVPKLNFEDLPALLDENFINTEFQSTSNNINVALRISPEQRRIHYLYQEL